MEIRVYETKKYGIFKKLEGNRDTYGVNKIIKSIESVGYIPSPICVNDKMEVIDGQNRLEALKALNMPVHYYIVRDIGIEEARQMNIGRRNWTLPDYFKSFVANGEPDYIYFMDMLDRHKAYSLRELWAICKGVITSHGNIPESTKLGTLGFSIERINEVEPLLETLDKIHDSIKRIPGYTNMGVPIFAWILQHPRADKRRVVKIVNEKYPLFIPIASAEATLKDFSKFYNSGLSPSRRILFDLDYRLSIEKE